MNSDLRFPFYAKASLVCVGLYAFFSILSITETIVVPLIYSTLSAILLSPVVNYLVRKGMPRLWAIILTVLVAFALVIGVVVLLSHQIIRFADALPMLGEKLQLLINETANWASTNFGIAEGTITNWISDQKQAFLDGAGSNMGRKIISTGSALVVVILIPIYIFMILHYQPLLLRFIHRLFTPDSQGDVNEVITDTKAIIQSYLVGLLFEAMIVAVLYAIALLSLGIDYAILLALIGALLNLIPYLGSIIASCLPMIIALATKPPSYAIFVLLCYIGIQIIDNNFIIPRVVASRVRVNALVSIVVVIAGGSLWGIPGMFIAIPMTAILKVIFDHVDGLHPLGYLMGDSVPFIAQKSTPAKAPERKKKRRPRKRKPRSPQP